MSKVLSIPKLFKPGAVLLVVWSIALTGCQGLLLTYKGQKVREVSRIALVDGSQRSGRYQSPDLIIDYYALRNGNELQLSGVVQYTPKIRHGSVLIPYFHLSVFLTDLDGNILEDRGIVTPGSDDPSNQMRFSEKIGLASGTAFMAFSYSIQARSECNREATSVWEVPIVR